MPIYYRIAPEQGLVLAAIHERATLADLRAYAASSVGDPAWSPDLVEVVDLAAVTEPEAATHVFDAARLVAHVAPRPRVRARAIVAPAAHLFDLAQRYRYDAACTGVVVRVFRDAVAALAWARALAATARGGGGSAARDAATPRLGWAG